MCIERNPELGFPPDLNIAPRFIDVVSGHGLEADPSELYCRRAWRGEIDIHDFPEVAAMFDAESLIVDRASRANPEGEYDYPDTNVFFVESADDETNAHHQGRLYYDAITAREKDLFEFSGERYPRGGHAVPATDEGAGEIRTLLLEHCR